MMKNFGAHREIGVLHLTPFPSCIYMEFGTVGYFGELNHMKVSNVRCNAY